MGMSRTVLTCTSVIVGVFWAGSLASAKSNAGKARTGAASVEVEGHLLEYEERHPWCTYKPGAAVHGMGESPWARFKVTKPAVHEGRAFGVLFKCGQREDLLRTMRTRGTGGRFVLVLPADFLQGKFSELEDCSIEASAMKRWRPAGAASEAR
jgi:hypothetical protein